MQDIDRRLVNAKGNPVLISQIFSRLLETGTISDKQKFRYLKGKCLGDNGLISEMARLSIFELIENNIIQLEEVLSEFLSCISTADNITCLTKMIMHLLSLQLKKNDNGVKFSVEQHPLVKILLQNSEFEIQTCIYQEIIQSYQHYSTLSERLNHLYEPFYLFCLCNPSVKLELSLLKHKLWSFLLNQNLQVFKLCPWFQLQNKCAQQTADFLNDFLQNLEPIEDLRGWDNILLIQITAIYNLILSQSDCSFTISCLMDILSESQEFCHQNLCLLLLSRALYVCPLECLEDFLSLCLSFVKAKVCMPYSYLPLKSVLLHWIANENLLTMKSIKVAKEILALSNYVCRERPVIFARRLTVDQYNPLMFCNPEIFLAMQLGVKFECTSTEDLATLVGHFQEVPDEFLKIIIHFLNGMLLNTKLNVQIRIIVLQMIVKYSKKCLSLQPVILTTLLHLLSISESPRLHFELLKSLPIMAMVKENVPKILVTIKAISSKSHVLNGVALRLLYDIWQIDHSCYPALEEVALHPSTSIVNQAYVFRQLAERRPDLYGKDLVAHLSKILNQSVNLDGVLATSLALEGIKFLCRSEVIDLVTTWETLAPKFKLEQRRTVVKSLCNLIAEIPTLEETEAYDKLNEEVTEFLWSRAIDTMDCDVADCALSALSRFTLNKISLNIPKEFLPNESNENLVGLVPGTTWINFLKNYRFKSVARNFLSSLVRKEIDDYLKYVYQVKSRGEPHSYTMLPTQSVVKALAEYLKCHFLKVKNNLGTIDGEVFVACLQILSVRYSKPLPPFDWSFLHELVHIESLKQMCLDLASRQAIMSGSARGLMETYIVAITNEDSSLLTVQSVLDIYKNLKYLANSIQPMVLKPCLQKTLSFLNENVAFERVLLDLKEVLSDNEVQDVNKHVIEELLIEMILCSGYSSERFSQLLNCVSAFSYKGLCKVTAFASLKKTSEEEFIKILKIRCRVVRETSSDTPLVWLNDVFNVALENKFQQVKVHSLFI
ncbi:hypothetical protein ABEB36_007048 [Hypothenemus hampei]|uniref:DUF3730 domain-containing protein n=1 Tax=Hypothenemus hampei TaxID=57062 RepID=A0ABD1ESL2_HYPHA